ncbi:unnamed protein product [Sphenostylis stenocarpa]|uniref:Uncharacterized protein n=1 Tax=Sphenostylis stenocarpa TaxID=92480 RepID=A0AA86VPB8_9FABA|nr:unnamed protein product [Sphenostylis stenocarpa]
MQGNKSIVRLKSSGSPLEVNTKMQKSNNEGGTSEFSVEMCIIYSLTNTLVTMKTTEEGFAGCVKAVYVDLSEDSGKGSFANLSLRVTRNERYGILCNYMNTKFVGSYDSFQENYSVPPLPDREVIRYSCRESGSGGCFTLEKKKDEDGVVKRVKVTHDFVFGEETMHVKVKIRNDDGGREEGLNVEVEGPVKLTTDYMNHVISRTERKMRSVIEASKVPVIGNGAGQPSPKDGGGEGGDQRMRMNWLITQRTDRPIYNPTFYV